MLRTLQSCLRTCSQLPAPETAMINVPTDSDNLRDLHRIGPIAQEMLTMAFAIAACAVALVLIAFAPVPVPVPIGPASAPQQLVDAPTAVRDGVLSPSVSSSADIQPEDPARSAAADLLIRFSLGAAPGPARQPAPAAALAAAPAAAAAAQR